MDSESSKALLNLGDLAKPATALVERLANGIGLFYEPTHIRRKARAEVDAEKIRALSRLEISELEERGLSRLVREEARAQANLEAIAAQSFPNLQDSSKPEDIDQDWLANFAEQCKLVSNLEMQSVWARILAGEANQRGSFAVRTLKTLANLSKIEAQQFTSLCTYAWMIGDLTPIVFEANDPIYTKAAINFDVINDLASLGLVNHLPVGGVQKQGVQGRAVALYYGTPVYIDSETKPYNITIGAVVFSRTGKELAPICGWRPDEDFIAYVIEHWSKQGLICSSPYPKVTSGT